MLNTTKLTKALAIIANAGIYAQNRNIDCQICPNEDYISVYYEYTFRRDTYEGAYAETRHLWHSLNERLLEVANNPFIKRHFTVAKSLLNDKTKFWHDPSEDDSYSEYEQSISSRLRLTLK